MFSKLFAASALAVVSAADVPVFSSNDDYDEINLNIRMLSGNTTATASDDVTINHSVSFTGTFPAGTTYSTLDGSAEFKAGAASAIKASVTPAPKSVTVTAVTDGSSRRARQLSVSLTPAVAYNMVVSAANAAAAKTFVTSTSTGAGSFAAALTAGVTSALSAAGYTGATITGVTAATTATETAATPSPAAPAAAAPSPSPSSNAAKVAVSTVAAFAAFMASMM